MFKEFKRLVETQSEHKIKTFGSDNDKEFVFMVSNRFLKDHGINEKTFTPYTSTKWSGGACKSYHCGDDKEHGSCLKPQQIILGGNGGSCGLHTKLFSNNDVKFHHARRNVERKEALQLHTICLGASLSQ